MAQKQKLNMGDMPIYRRYDGTLTVLDWRDKPPIDPENLEVGKSMIELECGRPYSADFNTPKVSVIVTGIMKDIGYQNLVNDTLNNYHRSWVTKEALLSSTLGYSRQTYTPSFSDHILDEVVEEIRLEFTPKKKIKSWTPDKALATMPQSTSAGLPYLEVKSKSKKEAWAQDRTKYLNLHNTIRQGRKYKFNDSAAFARSHISTKDVNKVRLVWAYPLDVISLESKYAAPIIEAVKKQEIGKSIAYGAETTLGGCWWLNQQLEKADRENNGTKKVILDYSSFDQTIPAWLIRIAFSILEGCIDPEEVESEEGLIKTNSREIKREWAAIKKYFINTTIRMTDGRRFKKTGGVPSGSCFTNLIDSICNLIALRYSMKVTCGIYPVFNVVMGDDAVIAIPSKVRFDFDYFQEVLQAKFNLKVHPKKSVLTDMNVNVKFLGYFNLRGQPMRARQELINSLIFPESTTEDTWELAQSRAVGVAIASAGCSETVLQICEAVLQRIARKGNPLSDIRPEVIRKTGKQLGWMINNISVFGQEINIPNSQCAIRDLCTPLNVCTKIQLAINLVSRG